MNNTHTAPIISIVIPVFNMEKYIARCLDSIINQSLKEIEIIIVNDLSTDNSESRIVEYVKRYSFIKYFKMQTKGSAGGARNVGIENATGKYIGFVDGDDWIDTMMYEKMVTAIEKSNADVAMCGVLSEFGSPHETVKRHEYVVENVVDGRAALDLLARCYNQDIVVSPAVCNKVYRATFLKDNHFRFIENNYNDDDVFNFICLLQANKLVIVPNTYYHYFQRHDSIMHLFSIKHINDFIDGYAFLKKYLVDNDYFDSVKLQYYSYLEFNLAAMINILKYSETNIAKQHEYLHYLLSKIMGTLITLDYINYIDLDRIKKFLTPSFKR